MSNVRFDELEFASSLSMTTMTMQIPRAVIRTV